MLELILLLSWMLNSLRAKKVAGARHINHIKAVKVRKHSTAAALTLLKHTAHHDFSLVPELACHAPALPSLLAAAELNGAGSTARSASYCG
jgi:hypothetical protein